MTLALLEVQFGPDVIYDLARAILDGIVDRYTDAGLSLPVRRYVAPGASAAYDCDSGQVTVCALNTRVGAPGSPVDDETTKLYGCDVGTYVTFRVEVIRQTVGIDSRGSVPAANVLDASGRECLRDLTLLREYAPEAATMAAGLGRPVGIGLGTTLGPDGFLAGSRLDLDVPLP